MGGSCIHETIVFVSVFAVGGGVGGVCCRCGVCVFACVVFFLFGWIVVTINKYSIACSYVVCFYLVESLRLIVYCRFV